MSCVLEGVTPNMHEFFIKQKLFRQMKITLHVQHPPNGSCSPESLRTGKVFHCISNDSNRGGGGHRRSFLAMSYTMLLHRNGHLQYSSTDAGRLSMFTTCGRFPWKAPTVAWFVNDEEGSGYELHPDICLRRLKRKTFKLSRPAFWPKEREKEDTRTIRQCKLPVPPVQSSLFPLSLVAGLQEEALVPEGLSTCLLSRYSNSGHRPRISSPYSLKYIR
jgi:hypothetical protein